MNRILVLVGLLAGAGCSIFCADCKCSDGITELTGVVTGADRAELVGATVAVSTGAVTVDYTRADGSTWQVRYYADIVP